METTREHIVRVIKAAQTQTHMQRLALIALVGSTTHGPELTDEISDALVTSEHHIQALQHVIDKLAE